MSAKTANQESATKVTPLPVEAQQHAGSREYGAIILLAASVFLFICVLSYDPRDPSFNVATSRSQVSNLCGLIGSHIADALVQLLGLSSILVPLGFSVLALRAFVPPRSPLRWLEVISIFILIFGISDLLERFSIRSLLEFSSKHPGGALGAFLHTFLGKFLGSAGEIVLILTLILLSILYLSKISITAIVRSVIPWSWVPSRLFGEAQDRLKLLYFRQRDRLSHLTPRESFSSLNIETVHGQSMSESVHPFAWHSPCDSLDKELTGIHSWERISFLPQEKAVESNSSVEFDVKQDFKEEHDSAPEETELIPHGRSPWRSLEISAGLQAEMLYQEVRKDEEADLEELLTEEIPGQSRQRGELLTSFTTNGEQSTRPIRVSKRADGELRRPVAPVNNFSSQDDYQFPHIDLLDTPEISGRTIDEGLLESNARILEQKLSDLGIQGQVVEIHPGPVITMYELTLASGIPLRKVLNTSDDLAMALKSGSTRIVAPIPGKNTVGIEVPNLNREIVYFREIIESPAFAHSTAPLKMALGKGIDGEPFATSLTRMPHLLIAGATGTGKSVGLNCLICSWLMSCHPDDVKFIMVDPKKLELSYYQDIPHLIHPVVTDPEKVPKVLSWAIREMERRYDLLSNAGAKNIEGYNQQVLAAKIGSDPDDSPQEKLPYIVIIVDELAELMMVAAKDIEISIARLAQMARASGIHLILATQRPSVDVVTGVIKANFPARISYQVSAKPDSRTILDTVGAEHLLGMGDMLFLRPGSAKLRRLHGAYVSENEIRRIADFIKAQRAPVYLQEITKHVSEESKFSSSDLAEDEKYDEAVELVTRIGHASISLIQRHMRIGYNRAARIIEVMEAEGVIGPSDGTSRPREVLAGSLGTVPDGQRGVFG